MNYLIIHRGPVEEVVFAVNNTNNAAGMAMCSSPLLYIKK